VAGTPPQDEKPSPIVNGYLVEPAENGGWIVRQRPADIRRDSIGNFVNDITDYAAFSLGSDLGSMAPRGATGAAGPSYVQNLYGAMQDMPSRLSAAQSRC
jgi:hypothetical protein